MARPNTQSTAPAANKFYPHEAPKSDVDAKINDLKNKPLMQKIAASDSLFPDASKLVLTWAMQQMNADLDPYMKNEVSKGGHAEGRSVAGAGAAEDEADEADFFVRPNGQKYFHRAWGNTLNDVQVLRRARETNQYPLLYGPPGTGKTAMTEAAFGDDLYTVLGTGDTEVADLIGGYVQDEAGAFVWVDGPLVKAAEEGKPILLDEVGLIDPKVLSVAYGLMDGRRELVVTANPSRGTVKAIDGFFVIGATNPNAPGVRLSEALLSRFTLHVEVTTDYSMAARMGVNKHIVSAAKNMDARVRQGELDWAPQFRELLAFRDVSKAFGERFAIENLIASAPEMARPDISATLAKGPLAATYMPAQIK